MIDPISIPGANSTTTPNGPKKPSGLGLSSISNSIRNATGTALALVLYRTDHAHRRVVYRSSHESRALWGGSR